MESKLTKNFLLERIFPLYLLVYFLNISVWKKYYQEIRQMRDEQKEIELLQFINSKRYKSKKYFYAYYALADLGNKQIKDIVVCKIIAYDETKFLGDKYNQSMEYGRILAYLVQEENNSSW
ncbi:MAG: hypothetical protein ACTSSK_12915 [Candidatus Heimdallarchaeota archaeon]